MGDEYPEQAMWQALLNEYLVYIRVEKGLSPRTVEAYGRDLRRWRDFIDRQGRSSPAEVERGDITLFLEELRRDGLSPRSLARVVAALRGLQRFLTEEGILRKPAGRGSTVAAACQPPAQGPLTGGSPQAARAADSG